MGRTANSNKLRVLVAALAVALVTVAPAASAPSTPNPLSPNGETYDGVPPMAWEQVSGADHYEVAVAADVGFNPTLFLISTKNTRATLIQTLVSGTYWWRVHAVDANGNVSPWSTAQSFVLDWSTPPTLTSPANGAAVAFPETPLTLKWTAVPRAQKYKLELATEPGLSLTSRVSTNYPLETQALQFTVPEALAAGTYYWAVTPIGAQGNLGTRSDVHSFVWSWPHKPENPQVTDLDDALEHFDPQFSWDPVPGAASYELEISSADATGSVVFSGTTIATSFSPTDVFADNVYNWRVRALDVAGHRGAWTNGPQFERAFDKVSPAIQHLELKDYVTGATAADEEPATPGFQTSVPLIAWDPVPGASSYQVQIAPFTSGLCNFNSSALLFDDETSTNAWSPLGKTTKGPPFPSPSSVGVTKETKELTPGASYCVAVRARSGHKSSSVDVRGGFEYLDDGTGASFTFTNYPSTSPCSPSCVARYLGADDYLLPTRGDTVSRMPVLTWEPLDGALSYWVVVAKDANFGTIVDYAFTRFPVYTPRKTSGVRTYADEQTAYYWAILPSQNADGDLAAFDPRNAAASTFEKHSVPPTLLGPDEAASIADQPVFTWTTAEAARQYRIQIATDENFSAADIVKEATTASATYSAEETYPADTVLWWRVQAQDEEGRGLTWSTPQLFEKTLPVPAPSATNPTVGDLIPTFSWDPVQGAVSYDVHFQLPDGSLSRDATDAAAAAATAVKMTGTGHFLWQVRANYPGGVDGPYTPLMDFTRTIHEPTSPTADAGQNKLLLSWDPKTAAKQYKVQIATNTSFSPSLETATTDNTSFAPTLGSSTYANGGTFYWRVAAIDADRNQGDWTPIRSFDLPALSSGTTALKRFSLSTKGRFVKNRYRTVYLYARNAATLQRVSGATVRVSGCGLLSTKFTNSNGVARFYKKATRTGTVTFRVSRSGYATRYIYRKCVRP